MTWSWFIFALMIALFGMYLLGHGGCCDGHASARKEGGESTRPGDAESPASDKSERKSGTLACH